MTDKKKYLYGPVPSRRLGLSLGIDIVPFKVCTLDCVYCQLGKTPMTTIERKEYIPIELVLDELKKALADGLKADYITVAGSGEPTLNSRLGELIEGIKKHSDIPVAILTNGTLLYREDVRADCIKADVVMPSLDAGDEQTFQKINRPNDIISIEKLISGLCKFRKEFAGQIWLEVFVVEGINTGDRQISGIRDAIKLINPDKIHLNTAVRPTANPNITRLSPVKLCEIANLLGPNCEVVAEFSTDRNITSNEHRFGDTQESYAVMKRKAESLLSMLKRRPCSLNDICSGMDITHNEAIKHISDLQHRRLVQSEEKDGIVFFKAIS